MNPVDFEILNRSFVKRSNLPKMRKFVALTLLQFFIFVSSEPKSEVVINELNIIDPEKPERKEFIELKSTKEGSKSVPLRGYKLIGLSAGEKETFIELVVTLWNENIDESGFFTIGGDLVTGANMKIPINFAKAKLKVDIQWQIS